VSLTAHLPLVDIAPLLSPAARPNERETLSRKIDEACRESGFFLIDGHGVDPSLQPALESAAQSFFDQSDRVKGEVAMPNGGRAWRGWFPLGGELTSGRPDRKEGLYFGTEHSPNDPRVRARVALHGPNQFPANPPELRPSVLAWIAAMRPVADAVMSGIALALGLPPGWFAKNLTADPTILFRIFHYPAEPATRVDSEPGWGVGEHTDYGLLTLLIQDHHGGLQVQTPSGVWLDVDPQPGVIICNLGDMLERLTGGLYRSTPHRVRNVSGASRLSFPYFFDPSWDATVPTIPPTGEAEQIRDQPRWDDADVQAWTGTYGDYLTAKVARVFPELFEASSLPASRDSP